jgi:hypothetical protein
MKNIMTQAYVYKWTHIPTLMWYIGSRTAKGCHPDDGYICSSKYVKPLIESNPCEWHRDIIELGEPVSIRELESEILECLNAAHDPRSYNRNNGKGKFSNTGRTITDEWRLNLSKSKKELYKNGHPNKGYKHTEEWKIEHAKKITGKQRSEEWKIERKKTAIRGPAHHLYGKKLSLEHIEKIRQQTLSRPNIFANKHILTCPHCGKTGGLVMNRWHFNKCKSKDLKRS